MLNILIAALLFQPFSMPPRTALENPATVTPVPKKLAKDYDKLWNRFLKARGKDDEKILKDAGKLLQKNPGFSQVLMISAYIDLYSNRVPEAEAKLEKVLGPDPKNKIALSYLADFAFAREDYSRSSDLYSRLMESDPTRTDVETRRQKALLLATEDLIRSASRAEMENRLAQAESLYQHALQIAPKEPSLHDRLGDLYARQKKYDPALSEFRKARDLGGASDDLDRRIAEVLATQGKTDEARAILESLKKAGGADAALEAKLSELEDIGRWGQDLSTFRKIQAEPELTRAELSALIVRYFPQVSDFRRTPAVMTDIQDSWARAEIQTVVGIGLIELLPNHTFQPSEPVTRGEFAKILARLSRLLRVPAPAAPPIPTADVGSSNALYRDVQLVLGIGLMNLDDSGSFNINDRVPGENAVRSIEKLLELSR